MSKTSRPRRVIVLLGGTSPEREVSLVSGRASADALIQLGWRVELYDWDGNITQLQDRMASRPDLVFNALHGGDGENGQLTALLGNVPYTHSPPKASALAMDKIQTRKLAVHAGIHVPPAKVISRDTAETGAEPFARPYVLKPVSGGSSIDVHIVRNGDPRPVLNTDETEFLLEVFIPGRELTVSVLDGKALAVTELRPQTEFYDYSAKYQEGITEHLLPAPVPTSLSQEALAVAERVHQLLGCCGVSRSDFRWDEDGFVSGKPTLYFLEINTQPGMTPTSLVPEQAMWCGMNFNILVEKITASALLSFARATKSSGESSTEQELVCAEQGRGVL